MEQEVPGFVGNRLQEALWREALHMVDSGQATVQQIDDSIAYGPGLRWALMGPILTFHLAGGPGGMAHMLDHFGPALLEPWTRLDAPDADPRAARPRGRRRGRGGRTAATVAELEQRRDAFLVDLLLLLEQAPRRCLSWPEAERARRSRRTASRCARSGSTTTATCTTRSYAIVLSDANEVLLRGTSA